MTALKIPGGRGTAKGWRKPPGGRRMPGVTVIPPRGGRCNVIKQTNKALFETQESKRKKVLDRGHQPEISRRKKTSN